MNDLLVKVGGLIFPNDFVILDVNEDTEVPIILGRPFLATSRAYLDVQARRMTFHASDEEVIFKLQRAIEHLMEHDILHILSMILT